MLVWYAAGTGQHKVTHALVLCGIEPAKKRKTAFNFLPAPDPPQTAAFDVFSGARNITIMGIMLTVGVVLVLTGVWVAMQIAGKRLKTEGIVQEKIVVHYIETGEVYFVNVEGAYMHRPPHRRIEFQV